MARWVRTWIYNLNAAIGGSAGCRALKPCHYAEHLQQYNHM